MGTRTIHYADDLHLKIAVEMLKDRLKPDEPWNADVPDLDQRLVDMLNRCAELVNNDRDGVLKSRQTIASVIVAWEATQPQAIADAFERYRRDNTGRYRELLPTDTIGPGLSR